MAREYFNREHDCEHYTEEVPRWEYQPGNGHVRVGTMRVDRVKETTVQQVIDALNELPDKEAIINVKGSNFPYHPVEVIKVGLNKKDQKVYLT